MPMLYVHKGSSEAKDDGIGRVTQLCSVPCHVAPSPQLVAARREPYSYRLPRVRFGLTDRMVETSSAKDKQKTAQFDRVARSGLLLRYIPSSYK